MGDAPSPAADHGSDTRGDPIHTRAIRAGSDADRDRDGLAPGLHRSSAYGFDTTDRASAVHEGEEPGHFYRRTGSPTRQALEEATAGLEGGEAGLGFSSGMAAFEMDRIEPARRLADGLELCTLAVSLGDVATLIQHSASMTHASVPPGRRREAGIRDGLLRMSVGLERPEDVIEDLDRTLRGL